MKEYLEKPDISDQVFKGFDTENLDLPPQSSKTLGSRMVEYEKNRHMVVVFETDPRHTNPIGVIQGGFLTAMLDDTIGPFSYLTAKGPVVTTGFDVQFIRGVKAGEPVICKAELVSKTPVTMLFDATAFNAKGKKIALMRSHNLIIQKR